VVAPVATDEVNVWLPVPEVRAREVEEAELPIVMVSAPVPPVPMFIVSAPVAPVPARFIVWVPVPDPRFMAV